MSKARKILIADSDVEVVRQLHHALQDTYEVIAAKDGSRALELSILKYPDLILFDRHCRLIGATQFLRILRANPRTEDIPIIVMSDAPVASASAGPTGVLQGVLVKPLNVDEVRAHIAAVLRKVDAVKQAGDEDGSVSGSLDQISMVDLLQIFSVNRRTGCLQLTNVASKTAEVFLREGRIEEAVASRCRGEKALFRLLGWTSGRFTFLADRRAPSVSINGSTDSLLMEGLRQSDELARLLPDMPSKDATLERLMPVESMPEGLHPITAEIVGLVEFYPRISDLVDHAKATDLEVYLALRSLLQAKVLRAREAGSQEQGSALLNQDEVFSLRGRLRRAGLAPTYLQRPKVAVVAATTGELQQLGVALAQLPGFVSYELARTVNLGFGRVGRLELDTELAVEFYAIANTSQMLPLAYGLSPGTVAAIVLGLGAGGIEDTVLRVLEIERRASLLVLLRPQDQAVQLGDDSRKAALQVSDLGPDNARFLMATLLREIIGRDDLRGVGV